VGFDWDFLIDDINKVASIFVVPETGVPVLHREASNCHDRLFREHVPASTRRAYCDSGGKSRQQDKFKAV